MTLDVDTVASAIAGATAGGISTGWVAKAMLARFVREFDSVTALLRKLDNAAAILEERNRSAQSSITNLTAELAKHTQSLDSVKIKLREIDVGFEQRLRLLETSRGRK